LPDEQVEPEVMSGNDIKSLESSLQALWEKARQVSEILVQLREKNVMLQGRVEELEESDQRLKQELQGREKELERVRQEALRLQSNGSNVLTKEEKEALKSRIRELITKINSHL
jgi:chromosome segregation ATPase